MRPVEVWLGPVQPHEQPELYERVDQLFSRVSPLLRQGIYNIFGNMLVSDAVIVPRARAYYHKTDKTGGFSEPNMRHALDMLKAEHLVSMTEPRKGVHVRLHPTPWTVEAIGDIPIREGAPQEPQAFYDNMSRSEHPSSRIRMLLENSEHVLRAHAQFMQDYPLGFTADSPFTTAYDRTYKERLAVPWTRAALLTRHAVLVRKFTSKGDGRFYQLGHSYQQLPKRTRAHLTAGGESLAELDYTASHISVLCGMSKTEQPFADPYMQVTRIAGLPDSYRDDVKKLTIITLNTPSERAFERGTYRHPEIRARLRDVNISSRIVREAVFESFPQFRRYVGKETLANKVMYEESEVMADVLRQLVGKNVPVLPIHDCVIVPKNKVTLAHDVMIDAFTRRFPKSRPYIHANIPLDTIDAKVSDDKDSVAVVKVDEQKTVKPKRKRRNKNDQYGLDL